MDERLVLNFHGLGPIPDGIVPAERPYWCDEDTFTSVLDAIPEVSESARVPIEITFDDGNTTDVSIALPALSERGLRALFFVCAGRIGTAGYLDGPAMEELLSAGMHVGSHGWGHVDWRRAEGTELDREIDGARRTIADAVGRPVDDVAIPFGSYDRRVISHLRRSRLRKVFTSDGGRAPLGSWLVPRQTYTTAWTTATLSDVASRRMSAPETAKRSVVRGLKQLR
jgi:peptidoglycan/xylan/chitin deacetylase (PgdA/CDA1 family)